MGVPGGGGCSPFSMAKASVSLPFFCRGKTLLPHLLLCPVVRGGIPGGGGGGGSCGSGPPFWGTSKHHKDAF